VGGVVVVNVNVITVRVESNEALLGGSCVHLPPWNFQYENGPGGSGDDNVNVTVTVPPIGRPEIVKDNSPAGKVPAAAGGGDETVLTGASVKPDNVPALT